jgi:hypothetical protein
MNYYAIAGVITGILIALACLASTVAWAITAWREAMWMRNAILETKHRKILGADIQRDRHWWSEDPKAVALVGRIGEYIAQNGGFDASQIRQGWRADCARIDKVGPDVSRETIS